MATTIQSCQAEVSTIFVYGNQTRQTAANTVYVSKKGEYTSSIAGRLPAGQTHGVKLVFKTDFERMQYLIGLYGRSSEGLQWTSFLHRMPGNSHQSRRWHSHLLWGLVVLQEFLESALALACRSPFSSHLSIFRSPRSRLLSRPVSCQNFPQQVCINPRALRTNLDTVLTRLCTRLVIIQAALCVLPTRNSSNNNTLIGCWHFGVCQQTRVDSPTILCLGGSKAKFGQRHHKEDRGPRT